MDEVTRRANSRIADPVFIDDFLRGGIDCRSGVPHKGFQSQAYDAGYAAQYELEQAITEISLQGERLRDMRNHS